MSDTGDSLPQPHLVLDGSSQSVLDFLHSILEQEHVFSFSGESACETECVTKTLFTDNGPTDEQLVALVAAHGHTPAQP